MTDLNAKIAHIEAIRADIGDPAADAAIAALRPTAPAVQMTMQADGDGELRGNQQKVFMAGATNYEAPPDPALPRQERALITYLRRTRGECNVVSLGTLDPTDADQRPLELAQVYIGLHTTTQVDLTDAEKQKRQRERPSRPPQERETRPLTATEALVRAEGRRLMLLGAPGGGKSTFVNHLALCLTGAALAERSPNEPQPEGGWLTVLPGWTLGALLPLKVVLRDFAAAAPLAVAPRGNARLLVEFIEATLADAKCAEAAEPLLARIARWTRDLAARWAGRGGWAAHSCVGRRKHRRRGAYLRHQPGACHLPHS